MEPSERAAPERIARQLTIRHGVPTAEVAFEGRATPAGATLDGIAQVAE